MRILILSKIDPDATAWLREHHDVVDGVGARTSDLQELIVGCHALIFRSGVTISADLLSRAPDLKLIVRGGSGYDNIDLEYVARHGIEFVRIPEPGARSVAELTFGLMLALARDIVRADQAWRQGRWLKNDIPGTLLRSKVLGIVGAGNIGSTVGELGAAWGMEVIGCVARPTPDCALDLRSRGIRLTTFNEVVSSADFLSLHVSLNASTRNLIDESVLNRMKPGSYLINLARGGVVDEAALRTALLRGDTVKAAALDVHEAEGDGHVSPLADLPNVVLTPHIGSTTADTQREIGERIIGIINAFAPDRRLLERSL